MKTILTGSATPSPPRGFRATFLDLIPSLSWSLERATTGFKIAIASLVLVNPEPYECQMSQTDGADILLFNRSLRERDGTAHEPSAPLINVADFVRRLFSFVLLDENCSFFKSSGGSDKLKELRLASQLFFEFLGEDKRNIEKHPSSLCGWIVAKTVKMDEGLFCGPGLSKELLCDLISEGADTDLFFIAPLNTVTLANSHDSDLEKRRPLYAFGCF